MHRREYNKLRDAVAVISGIPKEKFSYSLARWFDTDEAIKASNKQGCGTIACAAGWLAIHGGFGLTRLGDDLTDIDFPDQYNVKYGGVTMKLVAKKMHLSTKDAESLFMPFYGSEYDRQIKHFFSKSAKRIFLERVRMFLNSKSHGVSEEFDKFVETQ